MVDFVPIFPENGTYEWDVTRATYQKVAQEIKKNPKDIKAIDDNISLLQGYIFSWKNFMVKEDAHSDKEIFQNKDQAARKVIDIIKVLKNDDILYALYLAVTAQNYVVIGDWDSAVDYYYQMLNLDGVLNAEYDEDFYAGELKLAAEIIHNIGTLYFTGLKGSDAIRLKEKYKYIFDLENQHYTRIAKRKPALAPYVEEEFNILNDFTNGLIYYDDNYANTTVYDSSLLKAFYSEWKRDGKKYTIDLNRTLQIERRGIELYIIDSSIGLKGGGIKGETLTKILPLFQFKEHRKDRSNTLSKKKEPLETKPSLDNILSELDTLIGLAQVKKEVSSLINLLKIQNIRKQKGLPELPISRHLVFSGNPGTGKTTVARLLAQIYHELGILSKGQLIEVDRSGLVGGYVGQTAIKTQGVIQQALGGVLFIDEAYTLARGNDSNDYGQEAIDTILKAMEDHRDDLVVIVAGYPDLMERFINSNPGLKSRFNKYIHFEDYTPEELLEIFDSMCKKAGLTATRTARNWVLHVFTEEYENRDETFANGREVRNFFEKAVVNQANRLANEAYLNDEDVSTLTAEDVIVE